MVTGAITIKTKVVLLSKALMIYNKLRTLKLCEAVLQSYILKSVSEELGHFARECTGKQLDSKARYSAFKLKEPDKSEEPKALLSVDSMLNWSDHEGEDVEKCTAQVYGMIVGDEDDAAGNATSDDAINVSGDVSDAAVEFALMGLSS
ncbi:hypothetical protein Tco_0489583 [Tanacetum coccineum]